MTGSRTPELGRHFAPPINERAMTTVSPASRPTQAEHTVNLRPEELRGRASGVTVCAVMGLVWAGSALDDFGAVIAAPLLAIGVGTSVVLIAGSRRLRRAAKASPAAASPGPDLSHARNRFPLMVAGEAAAIFLAVNILVRADNAEWIPASVCAAVGLHFIPLARSFQLPLYYATAAALCLVAAATIILGATGAPESLWQLVPGLGAALALWVTGGALLAASTR